MAKNIEFEMFRNMFGGGGSNRGKSRKRYTEDVMKSSRGILDDLSNYTGQYEQGIRSNLGRFSDLADMFGQEAGKSYLDTTEGMAFSNLINQNSKRQRDRLSRDSGLMGLTQEAYLSGLGNINESEGASLANLVSGADARRSNLRSQQMAALSQVLGGNQGLYGAANNRFMNALNAAQGIQGAAYGYQNQRDQMRAQSNQNLMQGLGGLLDAGLLVAAPFTGGASLAPYAARKAMQ